MAKKFSLLLAAVAVLAFAIPSMASASKATIPAGTLAPVGMEITKNGKEVLLQSNLLGAIKCETLVLNGKLTKNDGTTVEGSGTTSAPTQTGCKNGAKEVKITSVEITKLFSSTSGSGTASFVTKVDVAALECTFTGVNVTFTYPTSPVGNVITFTSATGVTGSPASCGTAKLSGTFALVKTGTTTQILLD